MSRSVVAGGVVLIGMAVLAAGQGADQKPEGQQQPDPAEQARMMAEWMKLATPGEHHKHLEYFVGKWKSKTKVWMGGPGTPAMESEGTSEVTWVLGGRFIMDQYKGTFMGQPQEGIALTGYDNFRNMYKTTFVSNMGTEMLTMTGMRHPKTGVFTFYGQMDEPMLKVTGRTVKYTYRIVDPDNYVFSIIDLHAGDDYKVVEVTYAREP